MKNRGLWFGSKSKTDPLKPNRNGVLAIWFGFRHLYRPQSAAEFCTSLDAQRTSGEAFRWTRGASAAERGK